MEGAGPCSGRLFSWYGAHIGNLILKPGLIIALENQPKPKRFFIIWI